MVSGPAAGQSTPRHAKPQARAQARSSARQCPRRRLTGKTPLPACPEPCRRAAHQNNPGPASPKFRSCATPAPRVAPPIPVNPVHPVRNSLRFLPSCSSVFFVVNPLRVHPRSSAVHLFSSRLSLRAIITLCYQGFADDGNATVPNLSRADSLPNSLNPAWSLVFVSA